ncbi:hypothetical protein AVDCRST_MAG94-7199 [uncultured Leptolyngbya sp.]|uniref:Uncharacterized protein n=1 Tax=uncultured Leptolyngbya sp. TaxID=332963 RepID=A0A6J4PT43_9CYAN|nr:hypothetical protein AVDCRST_MAG94-7199 [uncultured Leptolyngbya sp.]
MNPSIVNAHHMRPLLSKQAENFVPGRTQATNDNMWFHA